MTQIMRENGTLSVVTLASVHKLAVTTASLRPVQITTKEATRRTKHIRGADQRKGVRERAQASGMKTSSRNGDQASGRQGLSHKKRWLLINDWFNSTVQSLTRCLSSASRLCLPTIVKLNLILFVLFSIMI